MPQFPDIVVLFNALVNLAVAVVLYYTSGGLWDEVTVQQAVISDWFSLLNQWVIDTASAIVQTVADFASGSYAEFVNFVNMILTYWDKITAFIDNTAWLFYELSASTIYDVVSFVWTNWNQLTMLAGDIWQWWVDLTIEGRQQLTLLLTNINNWLLDNLGPAWTFVLDLFADPLGTLSAILGEVWTFLVAMFNDPAAWLLSVLGVAWQMMLDFLAAPFEFIVGLLGEVWTFIVSVYNDPLGFVLSLLPDSLVAMVQFFSEWGGAIVDFFADPLNYILAAIRDAFLS